MTLFSKSYTKIALIFSVFCMIFNNHTMKRKYDLTIDTTNPTSTKEQKLNPHLDSPDRLYLQNYIDNQKLKDISKSLEKGAYSSERIINFSELIKNKKNAPILVTIDEVIQVLEKFIKNQHDKLSEKNLWLDNEIPSKLLNDEYKKPEIFLSFVGKQIFDNDTTFKIFGDLHGDMHSLLEFLKDDVEGFKIIDNDTHLVFLGDFIDRGSYGIEVLYIIAQLAVNNPGKVVICRGNHEDMGQMNTLFSHQDWTQWSFVQELIAKYGRNTTTQKLITILAAFYNLLPDAYLIGCKNINNTFDYILCAHGSIEPRHRLGTLMDDERSEIYEHIDRLVGTSEVIAELKDTQQQLNEKITILRLNVNTLDTKINDNDSDELKKQKNEMLEEIKECVNAQNILEEKTKNHKEYQQLYLDGDKELKETIDKSNKDLEASKKLYTQADQIIKFPNASHLSSLKDQLVIENETYRNKIKAEFIDCKNELKKTPDDDNQKNKLIFLSTIYQGLNNPLNNLQAYLNVTERIYSFIKKYVDLLQSTKYDEELTLRWKDAELKDFTTKNLGYLWGFFDEKSRNSIVQFDQGCKRMCYGKKLVNLIMEPTEKGNQIKAMFKGHQHNLHTLEKLKTHGGIFKFWTDNNNQWDKKNTISALELKEKDVVLYDAPCSFFGNDDKNTMSQHASPYPRNWGTFAELTFADQFKDWKLKPIQKNVFK